MGIQLDKWIEKVRRCEYLAEDELKALCEYVRLPRRASGVPDDNACHATDYVRSITRSRRYSRKSPMCSQETAP